MRPPESIGPYEVLRKLGAGGMGTVYLALDEDGRTVAVKVIHPHVAEDMNGLRRLGREVETLKRVTSPYVAELRDADLRAEPPYIVTRYVQGRSPQQIVESRGPLTGPALDSLGAGLMAALDAIHAVNVVHRDLTPHNVMIADGVPVVIDFGIAQAFDFSRITQNMIGTPGFGAPEVIRGERAGTPADVFSWGATMAFAATGRKCFVGRNMMETLHRTLVREPDLTGVPGDLMRGIEIALRKEPAERISIGALIGGVFVLPRDSLAGDAAAGHEQGRRVVGGRRGGPGARRGRPGRGAVCGGTADRGRGRRPGQRDVRPVSAGLGGRSARGLRDGV